MKVHKVAHVVLLAGPALSGRDHEIALAVTAERLAPLRLHMRISEGEQLHLDAFAVFKMETLAAEHPGHEQTAV